MRPIAHPARQVTSSMTRCPVSAPIPSDEQFGGSPGVTTTVDVGPAGWVIRGCVGGAVCCCVGAIGGCVGGDVACVGSGSGAPVVAGVVVVGGTIVAGGTVVVADESDVIRGIVSSGDASRESAHAPTAIVDATTPTTFHQRRRGIRVRPAMVPVSTRAAQRWGQPRGRRSYTAPSCQAGEPRC